MHKLKPAPIIDPVLANILKNCKNPIKKLSADQSMTFFLTAISDEKQTLNRLVRLECGHFIQTRAVQRSRCPRCGEMIRAGYDYEGFSMGQHTDDFHWPDDPCFNLNEHNKRSSVIENIFKPSII